MSCCDKGRSAPKNSPKWVRCEKCNAFGKLHRVHTKKGILTKFVCTNSSCNNVWPEDVKDEIELQPQVKQIIESPIQKHQLASQPKCAKCGEKGVVSKTIDTGGKTIIRFRCVSLQCGNQWP